jgi:hypothetical protein
MMMDDAEVFSTLVIIISTTWRPIPYDALSVFVPCVIELDILNCTLCTLGHIDGSFSLEPSLPSFAALALRLQTPTPTPPTQYMAATMKKGGPTKAPPTLSPYENEQTNNSVIERVSIPSKIATMVYRSPISFLETSEVMNDRVACVNPQPMEDTTNAAGGSVYIETAHV